MAYMLQEQSLLPHIKGQNYAQIGYDALECSAFLRHKISTGTQKLRHTYAIATVNNLYYIII